MAMNNDLIIYDKPNEIVTKAVEIIKAEGDFWNRLAFSETPKEGTEWRKGAKDPTTGEYTYFEYVTEEYCISMLNRFFAGWSEEDCKVEYDAPVRNYRATGYIIAPYVKPNGEKGVRKVFGVGGQKVLSSQVDPTDPVQPDDAAKGADTDRFKRCCKRLGIGLDIYTQMIPESLRAQFEKLTLHWEYKDKHIIPFAKNIKKKGDFEKLVDSLPELDDTARFLDDLKNIEEKYHPKLWVDFQKQNKTSVKNWLSNLEGSKIFNPQTTGESSNG